MNLQRLENFRYLEKAKKICEQQLKIAIVSMGELSGIGFGNVRGGSTLSVQERTVERIEHLRRMYEHRLEMYLKEKNEIETFINGIEDLLVQQIFILRFVNGYKWVKVALEIGGGNTEDSVRMMCQRYLKKHGD